MVMKIMKSHGKLGPFIIIGEAWKLAIKSPNLPLNWKLSAKEIWGNGGSLGMPLKRDFWRAIYISIYNIGIVIKTLFSCSDFRK